ncbi:MAG: diadenylate cyclase CdaA [Oscillospiraceae bacterium]|nr:diadenylate cyclase CdaA [Oscillospiraceae bacterium]
MDSIQKLISFWDQLKVIFSDFAFTDLLDICLVAFIIYSVIKLIRETRAIQLAKGLVLFGIVYFVIYLLDMQASEYIFKQVFADVIIVLVILFQPELRHVLESVGRSSLTKISIFGSKSEYEARNEVIKDSVYAVSKACQDMSQANTGSLIVFEKETLLGDVIKTGTQIDAVVSRELIGNIFFPNSPLHDGAAIIKEGRVVSAGCVLPLTHNENLDSQLGTRHRAALGMSEQSDAIIVVTSEETGVISIACKGELVRDISDADMRERLVRYLCTEKTTVVKGARRGIRKLFGGFKK